jgi:hypothetical protein
MLKFFFDFKKASLLPILFLAVLVFFFCAPSASASASTCQQNNFSFGSAVFKLSPIIDGFLKDFGIKQTLAATFSGITCGSVETWCDGTIPKATVTWPAAPNYPDPYQYRVIWNAGHSDLYSVCIGSDYWPFGYAFTAASNTSYTFTNLNENTTYYWAVYADTAPYQGNDYGAGACINGYTPHGSFITLSSSSCLPPAPAAPTGLTATVASCTQVNLSWNGSSGADYYDIQYRINGGGWQDYTTTSNTSYAFGASPASNYDFIVYAINVGGWSGPSNQASAAVPARINAPCNLTATAAGCSKIDLSWKDNATNETGFRIERSLNGSSYTTLPVTIPGDGATINGIFNYTDIGLNQGTTYYYRVKAYNGSGESPTSPAANAQTSMCPVVDLKLNNSDGSVNVDYNGNGTLTWTAQNTTGCSASGDWTGNKNKDSGSEATGAIKKDLSFVINCLGQSPSDVATDAVYANVIMKPWWREIFPW